ncbi:MAG: glycosyltransferase family 4 protein, partial [Nanoarchaeota archaeon]|nr:glycosyltransferase family 4 protein [Nanoarchaeota archaeon]
QFLVQRHHVNKSKIELVKLGVLTERFTFSKKLRSQVRKKYKIKADEVVLMYSGNIYPRKYLEMLVSAFSKLKSDKAKLLIVGGGEKSYMKKIKSMVAELNLGSRVIFTGFVDPKFLRNYYSACDIAVWANNNSISTMEAMACKRPVIMPALQLKELASYNNGYAFTPLNEHHLLKCMERLVNDKALRLKMGLNGYKAVIKNFDYGDIAKEFLKIAEKVKT